MRGSGYSPDSLPRACQRSEKLPDRRASRRRSPCHETAAAPVLWCQKMPIGMHRRVPPKLESRNSWRTCGTIKSGTNTYTGSQAGKQGHGSGPTLAGGLVFHFVPGHPLKSRQREQDRVPIHLQGRNQAVNQTLVASFVQMHFNSLF